MRTIPTLATATLAERAVFARDWAGGWLIVHDDGGVVVVDRGLALIATIPVEAVPADVSLDPDGVHVTIALDDALIAHALDTTAIAWREAGEFLACRHAGGLLWTAARGRAGIDLARRDPATGEVRRVTAIEDPFGEADVMFFAHPDARAVIAWVVAGHDGQCAFLVVDDGAQLTATEIAPRDRLPPAFTPTGDAYLSAGDDVLEYLAWPSGEDLDALAWADEDGGTGDDPSGHDVRYLPGGYATWSSANGRLYLIDLAAMVVIDELIVADHPLRTIGELHPRLAEDTPATDLESATPGPDGLVLTIHAGHELAVSRLADWSADQARATPGSRSSSIATSGTPTDQVV